jgi:hypothetical protein
LISRQYCSSKQDGHGHHQGAAGVVEYAPGGLDDQLPTTAG